MSKPLTPTDYANMLTLGSEIIERTIDKIVSEQEATSAVVPVGVYLAAWLFGEDATAAQILQCTAAAKAAYLLGRERAGFVGYG